MFSIILNALVDFAKKLTFKDWIILILLLLAIGFGISARHYYNKSLYPTVIYNSDSLEVYKNKINDEYVAKDMYIQTVDQLKKENADLYAEIENLKDHPIIVTKTKIEFKTDTIYMKSDSIVTDSVYNNLYWSAKEVNGYYDISGLTRVHSGFEDFTTSINYLRIPVELTLDVIENENKFKIIGTADNPYVSITNFNGAVIDPTSSDVLKNCFKQKRWGIGPQVGVGVSRDLKFSPYIGIGIQYSVFTF